MRFPEPTDEKDEEDRDAVEPCVLGGGWIEEWFEFELEAATFWVLLGCDSSRRRMLEEDMPLEDTKRVLTSTNQFFNALVVVNRGRLASYRFTKAFALREEKRAPETTVLSTGSFPLGKYKLVRKPYITAALTSSWTNLVQDHALQALDSLGTR